MHEWMDTNHLQSFREGIARILYNLCLHGARNLNKQIRLTSTPRYWTTPNRMECLPNVRCRELSTQILNAFEVMRRESSICSGRRFGDKELNLTLQAFRCADQSEWGSNCRSWGSQARVEQGCRRSALEDEDAHMLRLKHCHLYGSAV